jgi:pyridoxal phosphate enzyme (YggS family)
MADTVIGRNIEAIRERIEAACIRSGRKSSDVTLMAVSKFHSLEKIGEAWDAGISLFGENRVREAVEKFGPRGDWQKNHRGGELHLIGNLQRNKVKAAVSLVDCIESVDRDELIDELGKRCGERESPLGLLLELNAGEASKSGFPGEGELFRGAEKVLSYSGLLPRGLMIMAPLTGEEILIRRAFRCLVHARDELQKRFPQADWSCLSMGMSGDFEIAIEEGSSLVRIGTAIFGERGS